MIWILTGIIVLLLGAHMFSELWAGRNIEKVFMRYTYSLEDVGKKIDVLVREIQELKTHAELNREIINHASRRVEVFGNQLDAAFVHHKEEVTDLLDRLQAKTVADYTQLRRLAASPEEIQKAALMAEEAKKRRTESDAFLKQQKELRKHGVDVIT